MRGPEKEVDAWLSHTHTPPPPQSGPVKAAHARYTYQTASSPDNPLTKKKSHWFWQERVSHTACACEDSLRWRVGEAFCCEPSNTAWLTQCNQSPVPRTGGPGAQGAGGPGDRNSAPTWICMNVSTHDRGGGLFIPGELPQLLEIIHLTRSVIAGQHTVKRLFQPYRLYKKYKTGF